MDKMLQPSISVEKFAAYLDGNLLPEEMANISSAIEQSELLQDIMDASDLADETLANYSEYELALPQELSSLDFEIPSDYLTHHSDNDNAIEFFTGNIHLKDVEFTDPKVDTHTPGYSNPTENGVDGESSISNISDTPQNTVFELKSPPQVIDNNLDENLKDLEGSFKINEKINTTLMGQFNKVEDANLNAELAARKIFGDESFGPEGGFDPIVYQGPEGVCAIRSQQIILRDYGIDISLEELKDFAIQNGWYDPSPEGGTPTWAIGNLLLSCNVPCQQSDGNTVYDLVNELAQGHRIIVGVDANELWADREHNLLKGAKEWFKDCFSGETPNHALVVAGVNVNPDDPSDVKVILTDPGTGDLRIEYELKDFMDAWEDSNCFMVSTDTPAPFQYDPANGREIPSNFAVDNYIDTNSIPLNPNNAILPGQMAAMCADAHYSEGHLETIPVDGKDVDFDKFTTAVEKAQQYKSVVGGGSGLPGQDHFDKDKFVSSLKSLLGLSTGSETESETGSETGSGTGSETESETGSGTESETGSGTGSETGSETESETESDTGSDIGSDTGSDTGSSVDEEGEGFYP